MGTVMSIINWLDIHEGFISSLFGLATIVIACLALQSWKKELKAKKLYDLNYTAYKFLVDLKSNIANFERIEFLCGCADETDFNNEIIPFFECSKKELSELNLNLKQIGSKDKAISYFTEIINLYTAKESDDYAGIVQPRLNKETDEIVESDVYKKNFYYDYFSTDDNGKKCKFYKSFNENLKIGISFFENEMKKFWK